MTITQDNRSGFAQNLQEAQIIAMLRLMKIGQLARMTGSLFMIHTGIGATFFHVSDRDDRTFLGNITVSEEGSRNG